MQNYPLSIFHAAVRPESLPGADLSTFQKVMFSLFRGLLGPLGPFLGPLGPKKTSLVWFYNKQN